MNRWFLSVLLVLSIISTVAVLFSALHRPNFQVTEVSISKPTISDRSNLIFQGRVLSLHAFSYKANGSVTCRLYFINAAFPSSKSVALTYSINGIAKIDSFELPPYASLSRNVDLLNGQVLSGNFSISGVDNYLYFSFTHISYTQSIDFSFKLVNTGSSDGFAVVELRSDGMSVWSNRYYLEAGGSEVETGAVTIPDKEDHTFLLIVVEQGR